MYVFVMQLQERWEEYVQHTWKCFSPEFWELHHVVKAESVVLRNALFTKVRELTQSKRSGWRTSVRGMRERVSKRCGRHCAAGPLWIRVCHLKRTRLALAL